MQLLSVQNTIVNPWRYSYFIDGKRVSRAKYYAVAESSRLDCFLTVKGRQTGVFKHYVNATKIK